MPRKKTTPDLIALKDAEIRRLENEVEYWKGKTNDALNMADRLMSKLEAGLKAGNLARPEPVPAAYPRQTRRAWMPRRRKP